MEQNSERWLSFLQAHPDPITVFGGGNKLLFRNEDCTRILTPDIECGDLELDNLKNTQERLF